MAKEIYPFAYIVQGDFVGQYVYYQDYDDRYFVRSEAVYKNGMFSSGLWYNANYQYIFRDIIGYEDIGSATHTADAASVIKGGLLLGVVGAMAASAAGAGSTYDTVIYFKDGKKCVFRFLSSQVHQNHITSFHQLNIKPGNPTIAKFDNAKIESNTPSIASNTRTTNYIRDINKIDPNCTYDLCCIGATKDISHTNTTLSQYGYHNISEATGKVLLKAIPGSQIIKKMKARDGVCYGAILKGGAKHTSLQSKSETAQNHDGYITKPHLIDASNTYDVYCISYDKININQACEQLEKLGFLNVTKDGVGFYVDKIVVAEVPGKKTIRLINSNNGIKFGAKLSTERAKDAVIVEQSTKELLSSDNSSQDAQAKKKEDTVENNSLKYIEELKQLKELVDLGILTQEEFDAKKKQLLGL